MIDFSNQSSLVTECSTTAPVKEKQVLTFSSLNAFRSCPRRFKTRYVDRLIPLETEADSLYFGTVVHRALETWYGQLSLGNDVDMDLSKSLALEVIDEQCKERDKKLEIKKMWQIARSMVSAYIDLYKKDEAWEVLEVEKKFEGKIINPATGAESRTFDMMGKVDLVVRQDGDLYVVDHKTLSSWTEQDAEKLWMDTQMAVYCYFLRQNGYPIKGVIYNVLLKTRIEQKKGETQEEFDTRYAAACAKNKSGKSTATREMPESDDEYVTRLADWYTPEKFKRITVELPDSRMDMIQEEVWEITQQFLEARRRGIWLRNTGNCYQYHRACEYLPYCRSNFCEKIKMELFGISETVHEEFTEWVP